MRNPLLTPDLRELIQAGETAGLGEFFADLHPAQVAEMVEDLEPAEADAAVGLMEPRQQAAVLSYLDGENQTRIVETMPPDRAAEIFRLMPHDDRADLVNRLDEEHVNAILRRMAHAEREDIRRLASYEPGTAGAVMTTDYVALPPQLTVREAIDQLRHDAPDRETIDVNYVVDPHRRLIGAISLKRLILARPSARIEDVMNDDPIHVRVDEDQEEVARTIQQYDLIAIPVVDSDNMLVGIVTHDDAMDILRQEHTEDLLAFGGVSANPEVDDMPYWQSRITSAVRRRVGWLLMLFGAGTISGFVLDYFGWVDDRFPKLVVFIPLLIGTGGNAGSQTVGTIIRGLSLGEIQREDAFRVLFREWLIGLQMGALLGAVGFVYALLWHGQSMTFAVVISLTILGICMWANSVGAMVPLLARRFGIDPAVVSAPLISTLVDATGLVIFYTIAIVLLIRLAPG